MLRMRETAKISAEKKTEANKITGNTPYSKLRTLSTRKCLLCPLFMINNDALLHKKKNSIRLREFLFLQLSLRECNELECALPGDVNVRFIDFLCFDSCCFSGLIFTVCIPVDKQIREH